MTKYKYFGKLCKQLDEQFVYGFRNSQKRYEDALGKLNVQWALDMGFLTPSEPMTHLGEPKNGKYCEFSRLAKRIYRWNVYSIKDWYRFIKYKFQKNKK